MSTDVFSIHCDSLDGAKLAGFKGVETLNRPFELDVFFTVPVGTDVKSAIGARATLTADRDDGRGPMCWHGIFASIRLLHETAERSLYRAVLVPKLWLLQQHIRSFVHTKKKIDAFAADTLQDGGLTTADFEFSIHGDAYPLDEFVCQYRESHLDFVHRWFEREGLYYYFEHPEGAGASEKMIIADDKAHHHPLFGEGHVRYFPAAGHDATAGECFRELHADFKLLPASVLISDYNYANPAAPVAGEKAVSSAGQGKIREYGYRVFTEGEAKRLAQVKAQSIACRELVLTAMGTYLGLRAGYTFELDEGPSDLPTKYLAIEVRHAGVVSGASPMVTRYTGLDAKETYRVDVVAIPSNIQYRAPQSTPWPRIYGFENGTVDGPAESQYAQIDDQGRYLVRFKFDASDLPDGSTSTYLRMMQPHGGTTEGWHFPLRKGTEVMVSFQGGDPDRPVIAGVVPNAVQPSNVTSTNNRQNVLRSGGGNFIVMDDTVDAQYIDMGTPGGRTRFYMGEPEHDPNFIGPPEDWPPKQVTLAPLEPDGPQEPVSLTFSYFMKTEQSAGFDVGGNWWQHVGGGLSLDVTNETRILYGDDHTLIIGGKSTEFYTSGRKTITQSGRVDEIHGGLTQTIEPDWTTSIAGSWTAKMGKTVTITAGGTVTIKSPTILLEAPTVRIQGAEVKVQSADLVDTYGQRVTAGVHKGDYAAFYTCGYGIKVESTPGAFGLFGFRMDRTGFHAQSTAFRATFGPETKTAPLSLKNAALSIGTFGFKKL